MSSPIDRLRASLSDALNVSLAVPEVPGSLSEQIQELQRALGSAGGVRPPRDRMKEAIQTFQRTQALDTPGEARLVCFGSAERFADSEMPMIEDEALFPRLLTATDEFTGQPRSFRRCFRGLLHVYFVYDGEGPQTSPVGRHNWSELRSYLHTRKFAIHVDGIQPEWIDAIWAHTNLLTADPVSRYAAQVLDGDATEVNSIRARLEIQDGTWLMRKLILAQIETATKESDNRFSSRTGRLLKLLDGHPSLEDEGLAVVIDRYAGMSVPQPHPSLRDRAIASWGNPTFKRHSTQWSRVSPVAKQMIAAWATLDIIRQFFEVLSDDRQTDKRRLEFWQRYHEQIQGVYFALGSAAMNARDADSQRIRKQMGDHLLTLKRGGSASNNAFIMQMGDVVAVEFGVKGNACYLYKKSALPFVLRGEVAPDELRSVDSLDRLTHADGYDKWEEKFATALARLGIHPTAGQHPRTRTGPAPGRSHELPKHEPADSGFSQQAMHQFLKEHALFVVDHTEKGGVISVMTSQETGLVATTLKGWGFSFSRNRELWWRKGWT